MHSREQLSRTSNSRGRTASPEISKEQCKNLISQTVKLIKGFDDRILSVDTYAQEALDLDSLDGIVSVCINPCSRHMRSARLSYLCACRLKTLRNFFRSRPSTEPHDIEAF